MELRVGEKRHVCFAYIVKSKIESKQKRVIQSDQDVQVCGIVLWRVDELLCMIHLSSLFSMDVDYLSLFSFLFFFFLSLFFFDMPCGHVAYLLWVCIFYFIIFFHSPHP